MANDVKDLFRDRGRITSVGATGIELTGTSMPHLFLEEVWVANSMKCCFFKNPNIIIDAEYEYFFDLGTIKIPEGFQFVDYKKAGANDWSDKKGKVKKPIYTNLIYNITSQQIPKKAAFHICDKANGNGLFAKTTQGCSETLRVDINSKDIIVFYYEGEIYFSDNDTFAGHYLIPMTLSERLIVYFAVKDDPINNRHINILNEIVNRFNTEPKLMDNIGILEADGGRLQLNDKLGIFVTRKIGASVSDVTPLPQFPFPYDPITLA